MNIAKTLINNFGNDVISLMYQAEKHCIEHDPHWYAEIDAYHFDDGSVLWVNSFNEYGCTNLWFVFDVRNGIISNGFENHDQAVGELLEYVDEYGKKESAGFFGIVDLYGEEEIYNE